MLFVAAIGLGALRAAPPAGEFTSGPPVGAKLPGAFEPLNINGPDAGDEVCLYCKFGNWPTVMVFAPRLTDNTAAIATLLEKATEQAPKPREIGACVIVTDTGAETRKAMGQLADRQKFKHLILGVIDPKKLEAYDLHPDAELTVLLYSNRVVRVNRAFKAGELTEKAMGELAQEIARLYAGK